MSAEELQSPSSLRRLVHHYSSTFWLLAILLLASILRIWNLDFWGLWRDETTVALQMAGQDYFAVWRDPYATYIDNLLRQPLTRFFHNDFAFRFSSVVWGVGSIALLYAATRLVIPSAALWVALIAAVAPAHVQYSQEGRYYITVYFCVVWLIFQTFLLIRNPRFRNSILLALAVAVTAYTKQTSVIAAPVVVPLLFAGMYKFVSRKSLLLGVLSLIIGTLLAAPIYYEAFRLATLSGEEAIKAKSAHPILSETLQSLTPYLYYETLSQSIFATHKPLLSEPLTWRAWGVALITMAGVSYLIIRHKLLLAVALVAIATVLATVIFVTSIHRNIPHIRYTFAAVPFLHIIAGCGLAFAASMFERATFRCLSYRWIGPACAVMGVLFFVSAPIRDYYRTSAKPSNKDALQVANLAGEITERPVMMLFPENHSRARRHLQWYITMYPEIEANLHPIQTHNAEQVRKSIIRLTEQSPNAVIVNPKIADNSEADEVVSRAFESLVTSGTAIAVRHYDGRPTYFTWDALQKQTDPVERVRMEAAFSHQLFLAWPSNPKKKTLLAAGIAGRLRELNDPRANRRIRQYEDFVLNYAEAHYIKAAIYINREQWLDAEVELLKDIQQRPWYPINYSQLAHVRTKQFEESGNPQKLEDAITAFKLAEKRVPSEAHPEWFNHAQTNLEKKLKQSIRPIESP